MLDVDDTEAAKPEARLVGFEVALVVRPPVALGVIASSNLRSRGPQKPLIPHMTPAV
jgi:hypothetical protein